MKYILQVDFPHAGLFKEEFTEAFSDLAKDISSKKYLSQRGKCIFCELCNL